MRDEPFDLPALRFPARGVVARTGRLVWAVLRPVAVVVLLVGRVLLLVLLRLLRPFIVWPLLLTVAASLCVTLGFAAGRMWHDAARAGLVTFAVAAILGLYAGLAQMIDPEHFDDRVPGRPRRSWVERERYHDDAE